MSAPAQVWDADVLARVRRLHLKARSLTDALLVGAHRSRRVGQAVEFADYQSYQPGMDLRGLDWRVWARTDRLVVRRYETETELPCTVVLDLSGDMGTGADTKRVAPLDGSKAGASISLAATVLYWLYLQHEPVGLEVVAGGDVAHPSLPPKGGRNHLQLCFTMLATARASGRAELSQALARVGARVRRRSLVVVISDGMEEPSRWLPALAAFGKRGADLRFVHVFDPDEWAMRFDAPALFFSPEGGAELSVDPAGAAAALAEVVDEYVAEVRSGVLAAGGQYLLMQKQASLETLMRRIAQGAGSDAAASWRERR